MLFCFHFFLVPFVFFAFYFFLIPFVFSDTYFKKEKSRLALSTTILLLKFCNKALSTTILLLKFCNNKNRFCNNKIKTRRNNKNRLLSEFNTGKAFEMEFITIKIKDKKNSKNKRNKTKNMHHILRHKRYCIDKPRTNHLNHLCHVN